jgi:rhodanese-related sulfurtransferase
MSACLRLLLGILVLAGAGALALPAGAGGHTKDSLATVKKALADRKAVLLDVREKAEWDDGHLKDANSLPLSRLRGEVKAEDLARVLPKGQVIYCHCAAGGRCLKAAEILRKQGYDVRPLKPGYQALLKAGFPQAAR